MLYCRLLVIQSKTQHLIKHIVLIHVQVCVSTQIITDDSFRVKSGLQLFIYLFRFLVFLISITETDMDIESIK